ncbi:DUF2931 family protein [Dyella sp. ASV21]|uniref:DUF2931 family protein n=1 Tax=Dyella sp. ASV21 TaxID=2795114 RepID=UPI0018EA339B|nr:DUF2931 family protein [Dyella sp. ASV21]
MRDKPSQTGNRQGACFGRHTVMRALRAAALTGLLAVLSGCGDPPPSMDTDYAHAGCRPWAIDVASPQHMEAWVEALWVLDTKDHWHDIPQGVVGQLPDAEGWSGLRGGGGGVRLGNGHAPKEIYVRWQSLVEPQAYYWRFPVTDELRKALVHREMAKPWYGPPRSACRSDITIGVAPGGRTILWITGGGLPPLEIARGQAKVVPEGPDLGRFGGRYVRMDDKTKQYLEQHAIPYGSW